MPVSMENMQGLLAGNIDMQNPYGNLIAQGFAARGAQDRPQMSLLSPNSQLGNMFFESVARQVTPQADKLLDLLLALEASLGPEAVQNFLAMNMGPAAGSAKSLTLPKSATTPDTRIAPPQMPRQQLPGLPPGTMGSPVDPRGFDPSKLTPERLEEINKAAEELWGLKKIKA
jgi:hypothetical protein